MTLGLTEAQFWEYTPHHVLTLWQFYLDGERRQDRRFALLACMYANAHRERHRQPFTIDDFVPGAKEELPRIQRPEDMLNMAMAFTRSWQKPVN